MTSSHLRIAVICKRRYTNQDVISNRFGRLYEIPRRLALGGHDVKCFCIDYYNAGSGLWIHEVSPGTLAWESYSLGSWRLDRLARYPTHLLSRLREFGPDIVVGASDIPNIGLAKWLAGKLGALLVTDLYDDFTSFKQARIPGFKQLLGRSVAASDLVFTVSAELKRIVEDRWAPSTDVVVVPNAVDPVVFQPTGKADARHQLNLPASAVLVGTAGSLFRAKGIETLYAAWKIISSIRPDAHLVLAGPYDPSLPPPDAERVHYLGTIPHTEVGTLINALDVAVATVDNNAFGRSCFPQKAFEILACRVPIAAADVGAMASLFADYPGCLYEAGNPQSLAECVVRQMESEHGPPIPLLRWDEVGAIVETHLAALGRGQPSLANHTLS